MAQPKILDYNYFNDHYYLKPDGSLVNKHTNKTITAKSNDGYLVLNTRKYGLIPQHRIAYLLYHKNQPPQTIKHINGVKTDNRKENLAEDQ